MSTELARALVATLPVGMPQLFNPWKERCRDDTDLNGPEQRQERLAQHLDCSATLILCGEAPGHFGCRISGLAFTSEEQLLASAVPRVTRPSGRISTMLAPLSEDSATIVWRELYRLGIAEQVVLWNALQLHPHESHSPFTNRTPSRAELAHGQAAIHLLREAFPDAKVVAIGKKAEGVLKAAGIVPTANVRHPARGGGPLFSAGLAALINAQVGGRD